MLFKTFSATVQKYSHKLAINDLTYQQLYNMIIEREYAPISYATDWTVILDVLKAASLNKAVAVMPKFKRELVQLPIELPNEFGVILFSSGSSSGIRKQIFMPERMIMANANNAVKCQQITDRDKILTICSLNHTGGLSAQTIAGLLCGAYNVIDQFNAFNFFRLIQEHDITLTHLIPAHIDALIKVNPTTPTGNLRLAVAGSDCVYRHHVEFWTSRGVNFIMNYGMTEAGPIIINHEFAPSSDLTVFDHGVPLGDTVWSDVKIDNGELFLKGDSVITGNEWLPTGDCVELWNNWYIYKGRKSAGCKIIPKAY
jgi:acyl-coenzyme A synthetase/AMP-(fatty) acid ligase